MKNAQNLKDHFTKMKLFEKLKKELSKTGQSHLLKYYTDFNEEQREKFINHLSNLDYEEVNMLFKRATKALNSATKNIDHRMQPIPPGQFESAESVGEERLKQYYRLGLEKIANGQVGVILMAGGQGTRLGVPYPKGMYSPGLLSNKTLFQIQAERIRKLEQITKQETGQMGNITWYIMTSECTEGQTREFLETYSYFGLEPKNVVIFQQGLLPCFNFEGKILMENKNGISLSPDGNGGIYHALKDNNILEDMENRRILYVHVHSVDNILIKVADPSFIGYCVSKNADCGAKVVCKSSPSEAVGVVCLVDNQFQVVEYSEISEVTANLRDNDGNLIFNAGNICNHFFSTNFLKIIVEKHLDDLKLHVAKKKIPYINECGEKIEPKSPNGIKIEKFVFDVFKYATNFVTWEVPRYSEFSALKNTDSVGKDCPSTAKRDLFNLHKIYIEKAGGKVIGEIVEISPLLSYGGENLETQCSGKMFESPVLLSEEQI